jgi:autotransporter translocation and assembly factor TamB
MLSAAGTILPAAGSPLVAFEKADYDADLAGHDVDLGTWISGIGFSFVPVLGRLEASGHVRGVFPRIAIGGQASISGGQIGAYPMTAATLSTHVAGSGIAIDAALVDLGFAKLTSSGTIGLGPGAPLDLHVHASVPDVNAAAAKIVRGGLDTSGALETDALITGTFEKPRVLAGFDLENGRYGQFKVKRVIGDAETDLRQLRLDSVELTFDRGSAELAGSIPLELSPFAVGPPGASVSMTAVAKAVDLAPLAPLVPGSGTKLGGTLDGRIALGGTVASPRIFGSGTLTGGSYVSDLETSPITGLDAKIVFDGTSIALDALHGKVGKGTIDASGQLDLPIADAPPSGYAIDLTARGAQLNVPGYGGGSVDGQMKVASGRRRPVVSGDVTVYDTTIPFATIFKATGSDEGAGPPFDLGLDLHGTAGKNVRVKSPIIDVGATGEVTLTGTLFDPRASGVLTATRGGVFSTYQRLFRIQDATVTFDPAQGIVPNLDLRATAHVTNPDPDTTRNSAGAADITVAVTGPADSYTVAFSSEPAYSQAQIVALLAAIPIIGAVNFNQPQAPGTLRGAPGESDALLPPGVTPYQTGVYTFQEEAFSLLSTQLTQRLLSPLENAFGSSVGLTDLQVTLDYGGRVGYVARQQIDAKRQISISLGQVLSYPVRTQIGLTAQPDANTTASISYFTQNGTPSYQNSIFGTTSTVQVQNGVQPLSNRQGFTAVLTRRYP